MDQHDPSQAVAVAWVASNEVHYNFFHSMLEMLGHDVANHGRIWQGGYVGIRCGTGNLVESRNKAVATFLAEKRADWLFWLDTDMGFAPDTLDRLYDVADPAERPIVGALCFSNREEQSDGMGGWRTLATPTVMDWGHVKTGDEEQMGFSVRWDYPANTVARVAGTGSACILIHRTVFEQLRDQLGPVWYNRVPNTSTGQLTSEDLSFCLRAGAAGIPVHVHTGVRTTHQKTIWLGEEVYWQQRAVNPAPVTEGLEVAR